MSAIDVVVADRHPSARSPTSGPGSLVRLIRRGFTNASADDRLLWISPSADEGGGDGSRIDPRLTVSCASVSRSMYNGYYLTVGAERIWPVLHGIACELRADSLTDAPWQQFLGVSRHVAATVARLAPGSSRVTVHDYQLLPAVPEIRRLRPDLTLVYVHHTPWPHIDDEEGVIARALLRHLAQALASSDAVVLSAHQWKRNLESWTTAQPIAVVPPGLDPSELRELAVSAATDSLWAIALRAGHPGPVIAAVGRTDPSKNFDTVLRAWAGLVHDGSPGTLCLHLVPTTRRSLPLYRAYAEALRRGTEEANGHRAGSVVLVERECQDDALWLLQRADVVVACSRADGWNLVAAEACALGADAQRLILSSKVGARDLLGAVAHVVKDPSSEAEISMALREAIENRSDQRDVSRRRVLLPTPEEWWRAILELHSCFGRARGRE